MFAGVAELVYARDSKSRLARDGGSSPLSGTNKNLYILCHGRECIDF